MGAYSAPPYPLTIGASPKIFADHFWKDNSNPAILNGKHLVLFLRLMLQALCGKYDQTTSGQKSA